MLPSIDALVRHWKRTCWVLDLWGQADKNIMCLRDVTSYGWKLNTDGVLTIDWDSECNVTSIERRVFLLTKGCKCKGGCRTSRCSCKKKGQNCSEGCQCLHCSNLPTCSPMQVDPPRPTPNAQIGSTLSCQSSLDLPSPPESDTYQSPLDILELEENGIIEEEEEEDSEDEQESSIVMMSWVMYLDL